MEKGRSNRMITGEGVHTKVEQKEEEYFFSGGGEYEPITVLAKSLEEAEEKWLAARVKVGITSNKNEE